MKAGDQFWSFAVAPTTEHRDFLDCNWFVGMNYREEFYQSTRGEPVNNAVEFTFAFEPEIKREYDSAPAESIQEADFGMECVQSLLFALAKSAQTGILIGGNHISFLDADFQALGWREDRDYYRCQFSVEGAFWVREDVNSAIFLPRPPENWATSWEILDLEQAFICDTIALFLNYRGPENINSLMKLPDSGIVPNEAFEQVLEVCDGIVRFYHDGDGLQFLTRSLPWKAK